jgi:hypothetical protein
MSRKFSIAVTAFALLFGLAGSALAQKAKPIETFRAFAVNQTGTTKANSGVIQISIDRWSTDAEREALITTLKEKGSTALLDALIKLPQLGFIKMPNTLGWALFYARQSELPDGGRKVVLATNRKLGFHESAKQTRSVNYDFTLVEMHFDKAGKGEGKLATAAKVEWDRKTQQLDIENYGAMPVTLAKITAETPKP